MIDVSGSGLVLLPRFSHQIVPLRQHPVSSASIKSYYDFSAAPDVLNIIPPFTLTPLIYGSLSEQGASLGLALKTW
ncbi:hypothetical protein J3D56_001256 [Erwinia persicina]|jgi:hypothetical protein|uniref:Uncharacterized protein n=2 Tax=Erwinia TaxID=551 RepID=A0ABV4EBG8_9GAMM|nr:MULTISPECIES: hypothetical protein [Erwinia]MCP1437820.1 hypothetical protein [Erwinia persicina]MDN4628072.1 hypothetical protein [Erwinia sp. PsM31]